jgi:hypothetical protein
MNMPPFKCLIASCLIATLCAAPASAASVRKQMPQQDIVRQETVPLGNNRFLIYSGTAGERGQYGYSVDLVKIEGGIPRFDPLFIEEYNPDLNSAKLEYGVAFLCSSYHFDKTNNSMTYTVEMQETSERLLLKYKLDVDIFKLEEVMSQKTGPCPKEPCTPSAPKTIYKGITNAPKP